MKRVRRLNISLMFVFMACSWINSVSAQTIVNVPDASLAAALRTALGLPADAAITQEAMGSLTVFYGPGLGASISDLTGLETATALTTLSLSSNEYLENLSPLSGLTNLTMLTLNGNDRLENLSPLSGLTNLTQLQLTYNQIVDISPLSGLTNLTLLYLSNNNITNVSPLRSLLNLEQLEMSNNNITDISPLRGLPDLKMILLGLNNNNITDISPLRSLSHFGTHPLSAGVLGLSNNNITDISPLQGFTLLGTLGLAGNNITDVLPLSDLTNLRQLNLRQITGITNVEVLYKLKQGGTEIHLSPGITIPTNVVRFTNTDLEAAVRSALRISKGYPILPTGEKGIGTLTRLTATRKEIADLTGLEGATALTRLDLGDNAIVNLGPLSGLSSLESLDLADNQIVALSPLSGLRSLESLDLDDNQIQVVSALSGLSSLETLDLRDNDVMDVTPLSTMTHLTHLYLRGNANLTHLKHLVKLKEAGTTVDITLPKPVNIPDADLAAALRNGLSLQTDDDIFPEDMETLTTFTALSQSIVTLTGLETATALMSLTLSSNQIENLSPLSKLNSLEALDLSENQISNLRSLKDLSSLTTLNLSDNAIVNLRYLSDLSSLLTLNLSNNEITDVSPLRGLRSLTTLNLLGNAGITNPEVLYKLKQGGTNISLPQGIEIPDAVVFKDDNLEAAVKRALKPRVADENPILPDTLLTLERLSATRKGIVDLTGLEGATALTRLDLGDNAIVDLDPLSNLTNLTSLDLADNQIVNLTPLRSLGSLTSLDLDDNQITDVSALSGLSSLETLDLRDNDVMDVSPLAGLTSLTRLYLRGNENLTGLKHLVPLTDLRVDIPLPDPVVFLDTDLADAVRSALNSLLGLNLQSGDPVFPEDVAQLTQLTAINDNISDLTGLETATGLTNLTLSNNDIVDLEPLSDLTSLERLDLRNNQITDVLPLAGLTNLTRLDLTGNTGITNLGVLYKLDQQPTTTIIGVDIPEAVAFTDDALEAAVKKALKVAESDPVFPDAILTLTRLTATRKEITSLTGLEDATALERLDVGQNAITDLTPLSGLTSALENLDVADNQITDVGPLSGLRNLERLDLRGTQVTDVEPLKDLTNLTYIYLRGIENNITNLEWLGALEKLRSDIKLPSVVGLPDTNLDTAVRAALRTAGHTVPNELPMSEELLESLEMLTASNSAIADLSGLEAATELTSLDLRNNDITDVSPLSKLYSLVTLNLEGNPILDTSVLRELERRGTTIDITIYRYPSWDVNQDSDVDEADVFLITATITGESPDVNGDGNVDADDETAADANKDGRVDTDDLLLVFEKFDRPVNLAAPLLSAESVGLDWKLLEGIDADHLRVQLNILRVENDGSLNYQQAIAFLQAVLAAIQPDQTLLLANYPNPFNPETWIPYQLARGSHVQITIYDTRGAVVRQLALGHQSAGYYTTRSRAAHWDGRNAVGERVASGIYFYQLETDDVSLLRKMVILK